MKDESEIKHVSDTALWVATYRAEETERPDAVFRDHLASVLIGKRGRAIAASMPHAKLMSWVLVMRTSAIDRLVLKAVEGGVDTVVNLGAGLDTRPYRLNLPATLKWVEVDFPGMIQYKNLTLQNEKPVCHLDRIEADLSNAEARARVFKTIDASAKNTLVITEGVIPYLTSDDAGALSDAILATPSFKYWIQDFRQNGRQTTLRGLTRKLKGSPFRFFVKDWLGFFVIRGWKVREIIYTAEESKRLGRRPPFIFPLSLIFMFKTLISKNSREEFFKSNGYVMFEK